MMAYKLNNIGLADNVNNVASVIGDSKSVESVIALVIQKLVYQLGNGGIFFNVGWVIDMGKVLAVSFFQTNTY